MATTIAPSTPSASTLDALCQLRLMWKQDPKTLYTFSRPSQENAVATLLNLSITARSLSFAASPTSSLLSTSTAPLSMRIMRCEVIGSIRGIGLLQIQVEAEGNSIDDSLCDKYLAQSGCCKPPTKCGYMYENVTVWSPVGGVVGANLDCTRWSNEQHMLCHDCDSCKLVCWPVSRKVGGSSP
ncbi:Tetraspanin-4 protein [Spatholobus suberectus]|nr:Tetraspanin-4 protein [Spatholobus suberectus]